MQCSLPDCSTKTVGTNRYCSPEHKREGLSLKRKGVLRNVAPRFGVCVDCGSEFQAGLHGPMPERCADHRKRDVRCVDCGESFTARPGKSKCNSCLECVTCGKALPNRRVAYCSDACRQPEIVPVAKTCRECASVFETVFANQSSCSESCTKVHNRRMRRTRLAGVVTEIFDFGQVCERDAWTCQLCSKPVDKALMHPHPFSRSLDHIVPISRGGAHTFANAQLAHLRCNISKGNRLQVAS